MKEKRLHRIHGLRRPRSRLLRLPSKMGMGLRMAWKRKTNLTLKRWI
jgi:hypothetical protein